MENGANVPFWRRIIDVELVVALLRHITCLALIYATFYVGFRLAEFVIGATHNEDLLSFVHEIEAAMVVIFVIVFTLDICFFLLDRIVSKWFVKFFKWLSDEKFSFAVVP